MPTVRIKKADWAKALDPKYRYIFIKGGRSSGKSHEVGSYLTKRSLTEKDLKIIGLREYQSSIKRSSKQLIDDKIKEFGIDRLYTSINNEIRKADDADDGVFIFQGMNDLTADNVKSLEGFTVAWFEEAQNASAKTLRTLRPTIRAANSQIIFTWNPKLPTDPIDEFCNSVAGEEDVLIIHVNYEDNPFLTPEILREVELDKTNYPESFSHIWLGDYDKSFQGHYFAKQLDYAREKGQITIAPKEPDVPAITAWDLGMSDLTTIWVAQLVGLQWRIIDYYENNFEDLPHYAKWVKENGYNDFHYLPHDAKHERLGMEGSIKSQLQGLGINHITTLPIQSKESGISFAQKFIKKCWFDKEKTRTGVQRLHHYRSKYDEVKQTYTEIHDINSHAADGFRYLAQASVLYENEALESNELESFEEEIYLGSWMS